MPDKLYEKQKQLIEGENINVSETNVLKELLQIAIKIILILVCIYFFVFIASGFIIKNLPADKQVALENLLSKFVDEKNGYDVAGNEAKKINTIKNKILKYDKDFPKTSKLDVKILKAKKPNAYCLPNGNIYITLGLYEKIKNQDDMLLFVLAHEMAHYKNKDYIMNLRKGIASSAVLLITAVASGNNEKLYTIIEKSMNLESLKYSRNIETNADKYAAKILLKEYKSAQGGIKALEMLSDEDNPKTFSILLTHPTIEKRIKNLKKIEKNINKK